MGMQTEMENINFKGEKRVRKMEINPLGNCTAGEIN
jgi:hypothetical protein